MSMFILPESVRYDLRYGGQLSTSTFDRVIKPDFGCFALYFALKQLTGCWELQQEFLTEALNHLPKRGYEGIEEIIVKHCQKVELREVDGRKLSSLRVGALGPEAIERMFEPIAQEIYRQGSAPCLILYGGILGIRHFAVNAPENEEFYVLHPKRLVPKAEYIGFGIKKENNCYVVRLIAVATELTSEAMILVDDVVHTGRESQHVTQYLAAAGKNVTGVYCIINRRE